MLLILSLFVIWLAWSPGDAPPVNPAWGTAAMLLGLLALVLVSRFLNTRAMRKASFDDTDHAVRGFNRRMTAARTLIPVIFAAGVYGLGWGDVVDRLLGPAAGPAVQLPGAMVALMPPLLAWAGLWWAQFPSDRALREQNILTRLDHDMPVFAPPKLSAYLDNKLRTQVLFTLAPLLMILLLHDVAALVIRTLAHTQWGVTIGLVWPMPDPLESGIHLASAAAVFVFSPLLLRRVLHTQRLADSALRRRLETMCGSAGLRCRDILLWKTQNNLGNAAVMGIFAPLRYVILSDLLLASLTDEQIEAVFAHELGHVRHRHLAWFLAFFAATSALLFVLGDLLDRRLGPWLPQGQWMDLASGVLTGAVLLIGFGMLSRRFERQADVFAARLMQRAVLDSTSVPVAPVPAGPVGSTVFASALERIALVNNISIVAPNWTHGSIANRMRYIRALGRDPTGLARFDRHIRRLRALLLFGLISGAGAIAWTWTHAPVNDPPPHPPMQSLPN